MSSSSTFNGQAWLDAFRHASDVIFAHVGQLNSLNVFPVPDGDTGTNMMLTMKSAVDAAIKNNDGHPLTVKRVMTDLARGSLVGAHGNSGAILSQYLMGLSQGFETCLSVDANCLRSAMKLASTLARQAVRHPVDGTMLTVIADAAQATCDACPPMASVFDVMDAAADAAITSLAKTPELLDILRQNGVVDSGGQGLAYILRDVANHLRGNVEPFDIGDMYPVLRQQMHDADERNHNVEFGYCTNFLVRGDRMDLPEVRLAFDRIGTSVVVIGDESRIKVHIHTERPDRALAVGMQFGDLDGVLIDNMDRQQANTDDRVPLQPAIIKNTFEGDLLGNHAVVAFAFGAGQVQALLSLGATFVIQIDEASPPCLDQLLHAVESSPANDVLVIPNSSDIMALANEVMNFTGKRVEVVPATSFAAGFTVLSAMRPAADLEANSSRMTSLLDQITTVELAVTSTGECIDEIDVARDEALFFLNGTLKVRGGNCGDALEAGLDLLDTFEPELCTLFTGEDASRNDLANVRRILESAFPDVGIEVVAGGQPYHHFIITFD